MGHYACVRPTPKFQTLSIKCVLSILSALQINNAHVIGHKGQI